jgi:hypothetical protein
MGCRKVEMDKAILVLLESLFATVSQRDLE